MEFGLTRVAQLVRASHVIFPWKAIHIAGTNGKGSTSAFVSGFLHKAGARVGRFNSPHLIHRHDCISINEKTIDRALFDEVENEVKQLNEELGAQATSFELLTATALEAFSRANVDFGVIECGLGGTADATNVLKRNEVVCSVITRIGLDHQDILGNDLVQIARAKAGIIKPGVPVIIMASDDSEIMELLKAISIQMRAEATIVTTRMAPFGHTKPQLMKDLDLTSPGVDNLVVAYNAYKAARRKAPTLIKELSETEVSDVAASVRKTWRGRLEWVSVENISPRETPILVDGAHNPQAASILSSYLEKSVLQTEDTPITWVIAMSQGKDPREMFQSLLRPGDQVVLTQFGPVDGMPWVKPADVVVLTEKARDILMKKALMSYDPAINAAPTPLQALTQAIHMTPDDSPIVVTGSLYLVGDILRSLEQESKPS